MKITEEEKQKLLNQQHDYYLNHTFVLYEIAKAIQNRTLDLLNSKKEDEKFALRYLYAGNAEFLKKHLWEMKVSKGYRLTNLYHSNGLFKEYSIPVFTYHLQKRMNDEVYKNFNKEYLNLLQGFDMIFDIDGKDVLDAYAVAKRIKPIFDEYKLPYTLKFSGTRGFHLIVPAPFMPSMEISRLIDMIGAILRHFRAIHDCVDYVDTSVTNPHGIIKVPYSFCDGNCVLPLSDYDFDNFSLEKVKIDYVLKYIIIKNRGSLLRTHGLSESQLKENVRLFTESYK